MRKVLSNYSGGIYLVNRVIVLCKVIGTKFLSDAVRDCCVQELVCHRLITVMVLEGLGLWYLSLPFSEKRMSVTSGPVNW